MNRLPKGWVITRLGEINAYSGKTIEPQATPEEVFELYSVPTFPSKKPEIAQGQQIGSTKQSVQSNDVLLCKINPRINRVWTVAPKTFLEQIASSEWIVIRQPLIDSSFLRYQLSEQNFRERLCAEVSGVGGSLTRAQPKKVAGYDVILAPLAEQIRIAAKLDELSAKVTTLKARIDGIPALLKRFRQSVLAAAVSGHLTKEWRDLHGARLAEYKSIDDLSEIVTKGASPKWQGVRYVEDPSQTLFVTSENVKTMHLDLTKKKYVEDDFNLLQSRSILISGDVLTNIVGGSIGRAAIWRSDQKANTNQAVCIIRPKSGSLLSEYLSYYLNSPVGITGMTSEAVDVARANVSLAAVKGLQILTPTLEEQTEIVCRVEQLFTFADQLEARVKAAQTRIDLLTQSILAKAFRGELVPQDPSDEPASVLLERIKAQRAAAPKAKRGRKSQAELSSG